MATTALITVDQFERMPISERYELVRGELVEVTPPGGRHAKVSPRLSGPMFYFIQEQRLGELYVEGGFVITQDPDTVLGPDIAFVRTERLLPEEEQIGHLRQIPDLVIEIVSPHDNERDVREKVTLYFDAGVPLIWCFDPQRWRVQVWARNRAVQELGPSDTLDGGDVLPGFQLALAEIFKS